MSKLVVVVLLIVVVLASGCYGDIGYTECYPHIPEVCFSEGDDHAYLSIGSVTIPVVEDTRIIGEWYTDVSRDPVLVLEDDNTALYWYDEGSYAIGTYTWFAPNSIIVTIPYFGTQTQVVIYQWSDDERAMVIQAYVDGVKTFSGVLLKGRVGTDT